MDEADKESLLSHGHHRSRSYIKQYDRMDSWTQLVKTGTFKFLITLTFGGILCLCLRSWEGFGKPIPLSDYDVRIFNALTIAISICLGLNLLTSLKRYAVILRWSILTKSYVSMEVFDLILGIDELTNVAKLFFLSVPGLRRPKWSMCGSILRKDTKPGTNGWYPFVCFIWLLINIGSQILVASLSLFWPMEPFQCQLTQYGNVSVADLSRWINDTEIGSSQERAWRYGMDAQSWELFQANETKTDLSTLPGTPFYNATGHYEYRFFYRNLARPYDDYSQTNRSIQAMAICDKLKTDGKLHGNSTRYIRASIHGENRNVYIPTFGPGSISWIVHTKETEPCDRCANFDVLQLKELEGVANRTIKKTSLWSCKNTVSEVESKFDDRMIGVPVDDKRVLSTDEFARTAAGAISWTGLTMNRWKDRQFRLYPRGTPWSPDYEVDTTEIESIIMRHTIGAIAAFDDHGIRYDIHINDKDCDRQSQRLNVNWKWIASILGSIVLIQLTALCSLLKFANRAIVRDASYFSTAMLLRPVLNVLEGESGVMAMTGAQIKDHPKLRDKKIWYDYIEGRPNEAKQVTVSFRDGIKGHKRKKWDSGEYR